MFVIIHAFMSVDRKLETYLCIERARDRHRHIENMQLWAVELQANFKKILLFCIKVFYSKHGLFVFKQKT